MTLTRWRTIALLPFVLLLVVVLSGWGADAPVRPETPGPSGDPDDPPSVQPPTREEDPFVWNDFDEMHGWYTKTFVESPGFGMMRIRPETFYKSFFVHGSKHRVEDVGLIAIDSKGNAKAYTNGFSPMPERKEIEEGRAQPRDLRPFEREAVEALLRGERAVLGEEKDDRVDLVGVLRADRTCVGCHTNREVGDILGALSYRLHRVAE